MACHNTLKINLKIELLYNIIILLYNFLGFKQQLYCRAVSKEPLEQKYKKKYNTLLKCRDVAFYSKYMYLFNPIMVNTSGFIAITNLNNLMKILHGDYRLI